MSGLAVPVPANGVAGVAVSAAFWNAQVRDAVSFLVAPPLLKTKITAAQSVANSSLVPINWDTNVVDTYGGHSTVTNNSRYVAQVSGWYWLSGGVQWANNGTGIRYNKFAINGAAFDETLMENQNTGAGFVGTSMAIPGPLFLNVGDYVELWAFQSSGSALNAQGGFMAAHFEHS